MSTQPTITRVTSRVEQTYDRLMALVHATEPGMCIPPQDELALQFGVSRTVLREALSKLEHMNMVTPRPKTGTVVNAKSAWLNSIVVPTPPAAQAAKFLVVVMDDMSYGHLAYCADEAEVHKTVREAMFSKGMLDAEHLKELNEIVHDLLKNGIIEFEGDPSIHLYRLPGGAT